MNPRPATKKRKKVGLTASDIRVGQNIRYQGEVWSVAAPHPDGGGKFWLHRWVDEQYQTAEAHVKDLASIRPNPQQVPR
jgi:hypothetical protein